MSFYGQEATRIYEVIGAFNRADWRAFARTKLGLTPGDIEEAEINYQNDLKEQKFQMVLKWQRIKGRDGTVDKLEELYNGQHIANLGTSEPQHVVTTPTGDYPNPLTSCSPHDKSLSQSNPLMRTPLVSATVPKISGNQTEKTQQPVSGDQLPICNNVQNTAIPNKDKAFGDVGVDVKKKYIQVQGKEQGDIPCLEKSSQPTAHASLHASGVIAKDGKKNRKIYEKLKNPLSVFGNNKKGAKVDENFCDRVERIKVLPAMRSQYEEHLRKATVYQISKTPKGCVLILNNSFKGNRDYAERVGSDLDVRHMRKLWEAFDCKIHRGAPQCDKSAEEMKSLLKEMAEAEDSYNFLVVVIMSHGGLHAESGQQYFVGNDGKKVEVKETLKWFDNSSAKCLQGIPKLFIFQFCRGSKVDEGVTSTDSAGSATDDNFCETFELTFRQLAVANTKTSKGVATDSGGNVIPTISDMLVAYATQEDHAALRDENHGSWFINGITNVFTKFAKDNHVADLLTSVHRSMKEKTGVLKTGNKPCKAMSSHSTNLTKDLYLFPGFP